jgi:hypothetical protein
MGINARQFAFMVAGASLLVMHHHQTLRFDAT